MAAAGPYLVLVSASGRLDALHWVAAKATAAVRQLSWTNNLATIGPAIGATAPNMYPSPTPSVQLWGSVCVFSASEDDFTKHVMAARTTLNMSGALGADGTVARPVD